MLHRDAYPGIGQAHRFPTQGKGRPYKPVNLLVPDAEGAVVFLLPLLELSSRT